MRLITRLTAASVWARERHRESYARKLACTSSSTLADMARVALSWTIQPTSANNNVKAMDVASRIFQSSDRRENEPSILELLGWPASWLASQHYYGLLPG